MLGLEYIDLIKQRNNGKIPIDQLWSTTIDQQIWFDIPGFNGYQVSNDYFIRSFKYRNRYPYGILVSPKISPIKNVYNPFHYGVCVGDRDKVIYELSDNDNMRIEISIQEIIEKSMKIGSRTYRTCYSIPFTEKPPRNKRMFINQDPELTANKKGLVRKSVPVNKQENTAMAKFTVTNNPKPLDSY